MGMFRLTSAVGSSLATVDMHVITGMPALTARRTGCTKPARLSAVSMIASTCLAIASSIPFACDSVVPFQGPYSRSLTCPDLSSS